MTLVLSLMCLLVLWGLQVGLLTITTAVILLKAIWGIMVPKTSPLANASGSSLPSHWVG